MDKLMMGVAREVITPKIGGQLYGYVPGVFSESVEDDLTATAFYFAQGDSRAMMITATVCNISADLVDLLRWKISQKTDVPEKNILLSATHTHSGPNTKGSIGWGDIDQAYCDSIFIPRVLAAAERAAGNTRQVTMSVARGKSLVGVNRRELTKSGNQIDLGQNPWAPFDPHMTVLSFLDETGRVAANIIHYGCHGTCAGRNHEITRDWSGRMTDALEAATGGAITAFFNGPEGDIGPRLSNGKTGGDITYVRAHGCRAAADALEIYTHMTPMEDNTLAAAAFDTKIPLAPRMDKEKAAQMLQKYANATINYKAQIRNYLESVLQAYEKGIPEETDFVFSQTIIRLGDVVFVATPFELFSEIGMRLQTLFADKMILTLSNTNGGLGYFPTEDALCRGGYEVDMFCYDRVQSFVANADYALLTSMAENVQRVVSVNKE